MLTSKFTGLFSEKVKLMMYASLEGLQNLKYVINPIVIRKQK